MSGWSAAGGRDRLAGVVLRVVPEVVLRVVLKVVVPQKALVTGVTTVDGENLSARKIGTSTAGAERCAGLPGAIE